MPGDGGLWSFPACVLLYSAAERLRLTSSHEVRRPSGEGGTPCDRNLCGHKGPIRGLRLTAAVSTAGANQHACVCLPPLAVPGAVIAAGRARARASIARASIGIDAVAATPARVTIAGSTAIAVGRTVPAHATKIATNTAIAALETGRTGKAGARTRASQARASKTRSGTRASKARGAAGARARGAAEARARKRRTA